MKTDAQDYFVAGFSLVGSPSLGGGSAKWEGVSITTQTYPNGKDESTTKGVIRVSHGLLGLQVKNADAVENAANSNLAPKTDISGNTSYMHGGGIGTNGLLTFGEANYKYTYSDTVMTLVAKKVVETTNGYIGKMKTPAGYTFQLRKNDNTLLATAVSDENGNITFENLPTSVIFGNDGMQTAGTYPLSATLKLVEVVDQAAHPGVVFDSNVKTVTLTGTRKTVAEIEQTDPDHDSNEMTVFKATDTITSVTVGNADGTVTNNTVTLPGNTFTNQYKTGSISIQKVIDGITKADLYAGAEFTFRISGNNNGYAYTHDVKLTAPNLSTTIDNLPVGNYTITEIRHTEISGFKWVSVDPANGSTVTVSDGGKATFTATNKYELKKVNLSITKELDFTSLTDGTAVAQKYLDHEFTFKLTGTDLNGKEIEKQTVTIKANEKATFENLPGGAHPPG